MSKYFTHYNPTSEIPYDGWEVNKQPPNKQVAIDCAATYSKTRLIESLEFAINLIRQDYNTKINQEKNNSSATQQAPTDQFLLRSSRALAVAEPLYIQFIMGENPDLNTIVSVFEELYEWMEDHGSIKGRQRYSLFALAVPKNPDRSNHETNSP